MTTITAKQPITYIQYVVSPLKITKSVMQIAFTLIYFSYYGELILFPTYIIVFTAIQTFTFTIRLYNIEQTQTETYTAAVTNKYNKKREKASKVHLTETDYILFTYNMAVTESKHNTSFLLPEAINRNRIQKN